jgi:hypothetical protein
MILQLSDRILAPSGEVRRLIEEGFRGVGKDAVEVHVVANRSRWNFSGRAWPELPRGRASSRETRYLVEISMPRRPSDEGFPYRWKYPRLKTAPRLVANSWEERLVALAAHEAYHVKQFRFGMRKSEVTAERWAGRALERYRARTLPTFPASSTSRSTTRGRWSEADAVRSSTGTRAARMSTSPETNA